MDSLDLLTPYLFKHKGLNFLISEGMLPEDIDAVQHFEMRPTDVILATYPKSGTTWMQQILVQIMDAAHPGWARDATNRLNIPVLEERNRFRERPDPRIFITHLYPDMLPQDVKAKRNKVVYVWRNPKDVLVSFYHFSHTWPSLERPQSFEKFYQQFLDGDVYMGSWFDHVRKYREAQDQLEIHYMQYENMLKDLRGEVVKLCAFLGKDLTDEAIDHVVETSIFKNMKTDPRGNYKDVLEFTRFKGKTMRKGIAGDWKNEFTVAQDEHFDNVFKEKMGNFPLPITWEIKQ